MRGIFDCGVCLVIFGKCENKGVVRWKLCELALRKCKRCESERVSVVGCEVRVSEGIRCSNICTIVEDSFLPFCWHISHTVLRDVTRTSTSKTDSVSFLLIAPIKIFEFGFKP